MSIFGAKKAKVARFGRDRSIRITGATRSLITDAYQVTPTKAVIPSENHSCEYWTFPLWGFGKYVKMAAVKREPLLASVMGDAVTLSPVMGSDKDYRDKTNKVTGDRLEQFADMADYYATQKIQLKQSKRPGDLFLNLLGFALLLELVIFGAIALPAFIPKILENSGG